MDLSRSQARQPPNNSCMWCKERPVYAHVFEPKSGMSLAEPPFDVPVFYHWSPEYVGSWLREIGFRQYSGLFRCRGLTGERLYHMEPQDLLRVGVATMAEAQRIIWHIRQLDKYVEQQKKCIPPGNPYICYKSLYFGEVPFHSTDFRPRDGCRQ